MSAVAAAGLPALLACPKCGQPIPDLSAEHFVRCEHCGTALSGHLFPALESGSHLQIQRGERALEGDAVCFFHPEKRAEQSCGRCGRFVCGLCEMPVGSEHLCPTCLGSGLKSGKMEELTPRRIVWGQMALLAGGVPLLIAFVWPLFIVTGPAAVGLAIYGWKKPGSLVNGRRRVAASFGLLFGLVQIAIFVGLTILIQQTMSTL